MGKVHTTSQCQKEFLRNKITIPELLGWEQGNLAYTSKFKAICICYDVEKYFTLGQRLCIHSLEERKMCRSSGRIGLKL